MLFPLINVLYLHISTSRSLSAVPNMAVFCVTLISCFPGMLFRYCLSYFEMVPVAPDSILTPWCRVLLEKLTGLQLVKKLPAFHGTRRFITALRSVRHLSLSWASPIQSIYTHPTSWSCPYYYYLLSLLRPHSTCTEILL